MKEKKEWLTKAKKREVKKKDRGVVDMARILYHFPKICRSGLMKYLIHGILPIPLIPSLI